MLHCNNKINFFGYKCRKFLYSLNTYVNIYGGHFETKRILKILKRNRKHELKIL